jgi:hypothetical protein
MGSGVDRGPALRDLDRRSGRSNASRASTPIRIEAASALWR